MGKSTTSVAAVVAITSTQFTELSALGLLDAKADRKSGEGRGALITWCIKHGINTANYAKNSVKRSLSQGQVDLLKKQTLVKRLSDDAQALYAMGGTKAAGRVAADTDGNTHTEKGVAKDYRYYDGQLNSVLKDIQKGIEARKIKAARIAAGGSGNRTLITAVAEENAKFFKRTYKDEDITLPEGHDVEGLQGMIKALIVYVGGTLPVIKD
tara:strand:+ start:81 stop:713 length:633 start_codon:yes stop_codon:yes gene_type:complete